MYINKYFFIELKEVNKYASHYNERMKWVLFSIKMRVKWTLCEGS